MSGNWNIEELYCIVYIVQSRGGRGGWWGFSFSVVAEEVGWGVGGALEGGVVFVCWGAEYMKGVVVEGKGGL